VRPMLEAASAKVNGEPCAAHVGNGSAGHFVKMVHNGIEYGLMQLIAEAYDLLKRGFRKSDREISDLFAEWNAGELNSFLVEITSTVLRKTDAESGKALVDLILDSAGQKGTGRWTSQIAVDLGVPIPTIDSAVTMRQISARKAERVAASAKYDKANAGYDLGDTKYHLGNKSTAMPDDFAVGAVQLVRDSLEAGFIITYAQGLSLLKTASPEKNFAFDMVEITKIWRGGCIIRAAMLEDIRKAYESEPGLENIVSSDVFVAKLNAGQQSLKMAVNISHTYGVSCMAGGASLNYLMAYTSGRLPANLIQAQRDYFGAHTYQRIDKEGTFHTPDWEVSNGAE
ncbi:MAG TPA: hypothetical protein VMZ26_05270, partial [Pyrinomonadaceae bacterium]|nr:hypothetical protein [Pyrinomonadaceae bacterium]